MYTTSTSTSTSTVSSEMSSGLFPHMHMHMPASPGGEQDPVFSARGGLGVNLAGSWLDLESDSEDPAPRLLVRRKNSAASAKERSALANIRELKHRSTLRIRRLTDKMTR
ncbi:hypothetical protein H4S01_006046 [Coemansia sp. RSA 2610]|nr:hypothetical protein IWW52_005037 [Coemansia sp. RSA 2704]KAJ2359704.1 hypothetical protein H4S01_006046 [Coemansia sp. RSA 2610]